LGISLSKQGPRHRRRALHIGSGSLCDVHKMSTECVERPSFSTEKSRQTREEPQRKTVFAAHLSTSRFHRITRAFSAYSGRSCRVFDNSPHELSPCPATIYE